jgi:hypothetical protein
MLLLIGSISAVLSASAQPTLEFANGSGPLGTGASVANQVITFQDNTNNPIGNNFSAYSTPTITTTFSLSNQQYTLNATQVSTRAGVNFGATTSGASQMAANFNLFPLMNAVSAAPSNDFTSGPIIPAGTGISTGFNYATEIFTSAMGLYNAGSSTTGRYYMADLTITFSSPLTNPVIHIVGIGGAVPEGAQTLGLTTEFDLKTAGVTLSKLSGSAELSVNSTQILNSALHPSATTGSGAASGTIQVTGTGITSLVFKIYLRGDGVGAVWSSNAEHTGDAFLIGVSTLITNIVLPVGLLDFTATAQSDHTAELQWATATEEYSSFFDVEYSRDQTSWQSIGSVQAAGNSNTQKNYSFIHNSPASGNNYYRLKEVDKDGNGTYSTVCVVSFSEASQLSFYPNPVKGRVTITNGSSALGSVSVLTIDGRQLQQSNHFNSGESLDLSSYPTGIYLLAIKNASGATEVLKVLKN